MIATGPHYLLYSEAGRGKEPGSWRFVLRATAGLDQVEVADAEPDVRGERLSLLTVIRALESLDQPSRVTLMTSDPYVRQGIRFGLPEWRSNGWQWEFFGQMVPIKHCDLWQRMDRALRFHRIDFGCWRVDRPHTSVVASAVVGRDASGRSGTRLAGFDWFRTRWSDLCAGFRAWVEASLGWWRVHTTRSAAPAATCDQADPQEDRNYSELVQAGESSDQD
jgi:hypothetical protein